MFGCHNLRYRITSFKCREIFIFVIYGSFSFSLPRCLASCRSSRNLRFKPKQSAMLRAFKISSFDKTVFRRYSIFRTSGITRTEDADIGYRFFHSHKTPDSSFSRFSSARKFSAGSQGLGKLLPDVDVREKDDVTLNDSVLHDKCDPPPEILQDQEESLLKIDNLELLKDIANGDDNVLELLKSIQVKLDIAACQYGVKINVSREDWWEFLNNTSSKRKTFAAFLIVNTLREMKKNYENPAPLYDLCTDEEDDSSELYDDVRCYHLFHNSMFLKLRPNTIRRIYYAKGLTAMLYSSSIVIDCSYGDFMAGFELKDLAKQLNVCASINCKSDQPFHLMLCNFNKDDQLGKILQKLNPIIYNDEFPLTITSKSYLDLFPKSELVYLTPHCKTSLKNYDPNKTYIIGGFVDKTQKKPISLAKAKELEIPMAKLPLDEFLDWGMGDKCLSLPHMVKIMLDLRATDGNWHKALEAVPKRCLVKNKGKAPKTSTELFISSIYDVLGH